MQGQFKLIDDERRGEQEQSIYNWWPISTSVSWLWKDSNSWQTLDPIALSLAIASMPPPIARPWKVHCQLHTRKAPLLHDFARAQRERIASSFCLPGAANEMAPNRQAWPMGAGINAVLALSHVFEHWWTTDRADPRCFDTSPAVWLWALNLMILLICRILIIKESWMNVSSKFSKKTWKWILSEGCIDKENRECHWHWRMDPLPQACQHEWIQWLQKHELVWQLRCCFDLVFCLHLDRSFPASN